MIVLARLAFLATLIATSIAQSTSNIDAGPNTVGFYNTALRTMSQNGTWAIVPISKSVVQKAVPYPLISCTKDKSLFPKGFPSGKVPVFVITGFEFDIRMGNLEIDSLMAGQLYVPCVDRLRDGHTLFQYPIAQYIGGTNGQDLMAYVPAYVGTLESSPIQTGKIYPDYLAYRQTGPNEFSSQVKQMVAANSASGPGIIPPALDMEWSIVGANQYSSNTFQSLMNQPIIAKTGDLCLRNSIYFNETFANPIFTLGQVTIYSVAGVQPASFAGRYTNIGGYSGNGEIVGHNLQACATAAKQNDLPVS